MLFSLGEVGYSPFLTKLEHFLFREKKKQVYTSWVEELCCHYLFFVFDLGLSQPGIEPWSSTGSPWLAKKQPVSSYTYWYGGILLTFSYKINYIKMLHNFLDMLVIFFNMRHIFVNLKHACQHVNIHVIVHEK